MGEDDAGGRNSDIQSRRGKRQSQMAVALRQNRVCDLQICAGATLRS